MAIKISKIKVNNNKDIRGQILVASMIDNYLKSKGIEFKIDII